MEAKKASKRVVQFRLPPALHEKMVAIADDLGCSMNAWAIRALAHGAKTHVPLDTYINTAGKGRSAGARLSPFRGLLVDEMGVPEGVSLADGELELHRQLKEGGEPGLQRFMQMLWTAAKIDQPYTDSHLAETVRVLRADE